MHGSVIKVDMATKTASIVPNASTHPVQQDCDYLVAASGLRRAWPIVPQSVRRDAYLAEVQCHIDSVKNARHSVVVIDGGAF